MKDNPSLMRPKAEDVLREISGDAGPPVQSLGRAYGVTIFGECQPAIPNPLSPDEVKALGPGDGWRSGVSLNLISDEILQRGFSVEICGCGADQYLQATRDDVPALLVVRISTLYQEPFILEIGGLGLMPSFVRSHSTTRRGLLRTVDVFLGGVRAGRSPVSSEA